MRGAGRLEGAGPSSRGAAASARVTHGHPTRAGYTVTLTDTDGAGQVGSAQRVVTGRNAGS